MYFVVENVEKKENIWYETLVKPYIHLQFYQDLEECEVEYMEVNLK